MAFKSNNIENFWQELKRRKVVHVITVYAAVSFIILQLVDIISKPLQLPEWTLTFMIVLLCAGFIIAVLLSWIYDKTPAGVKKTKPVSAKKHSDQATSTTSSGWKIATYASGVIIIGLVAFNFSSRRSPNADISKLDKSIAVLPFLNDSSSDSTTYFINGLMDEILDNLQIIGAFSKVLSRTSTEQYRGIAKPPMPKIAKDLDVNFIVEGSGQKYGNFYRIRVQLIEGKTDKHLWVNSYEREIKGTNDIFGTQSEIAQSIASALKATITPEEKQLIEKTPTTNLTASDFYMQGIEQLSGHSRYYADPVALNRSENSFIEALKYDTTFSLAYSGLAYVYRLKNLPKQYYSTQYLDSCRMLIDKSLEFDNKNAEAYYTKALYFWDLGRWDMVSEELDNALKYNPNYTDVYSFRGDLYYTWNYDNIDYIKAAENLLKAASLNRGKDLPVLLYDIGFLFEDFCGFPDVANYYLNEALNLEKDSVTYWDNLSTCYRDEGNYIKAIELARKTIAATDSVSVYALNLANYLSFNGNNKESLIWFIKYFEWVKKNNILENGNYHRIAYAYWMNGKKEEALSWFNEQKKYCKETIEKKRWYIVGSYYDLAAVNAFLGDKKEAYKYLNLFSQIPVCPKWWLNMIKNDPLFYPISNEIEFLNIVADLDRKYKAEHERVKKWLEEQGKL